LFSNNVKHIAQNIFKQIFLRFVPRNEGKAIGQQFEVEHSQGPKVGLEV